MPELTEWNSFPGCPDGNANNVALKGAADEGHVCPALNSRGGQSRPVVGDLAEKEQVCPPPIGPTNYLIPEAAIVLLLDVTWAGTRRIIFTTISLSTRLLEFIAASGSGENPDVTTDWVMLAELGNLGILPHSGTSLENCINVIE